MISRSDLLGMLPPFENKWQMLVRDQSTHDIITGILECHQLDQGDYDRISEQFLRDTPRETLRAIFRFLKRNVPYYVESTEGQTLRPPSSIVAFSRVDCKNYALFINGIMASLNRKGLMRVPMAYRFATYSWLDGKEPKHVFAVAYPGTKNEIWIDPVLDSFDQRKKPYYFKDEKLKPMALYRVSGIEEPPVLSQAERTDILVAYRQGLAREREDRIQSGDLAILSPAEQQYLEAIDVVDDLIEKNTIGFIDPGTITAAVSVITSLFGHRDKGPGYLGWDRIDVREGDGLGASAADVVLNARTDVPISDLLSYIQEGQGLQNMLSNRKYGTVTLEKLADYIEFRGYPQEAEAIRKSGTSPAAGGGASSPPAPTGKKDDTLLLVGGLVLVGGAIWYASQKKSKKRR